MKPGRRRPVRTRSRPVIAGDPAAAPGRAAAAGEFVVEREAEGAVVHADFFARGDAAQRDDVVRAVVAGIGIAGVIDEIDRVAHRLGVERAGDLRPARCCRRSAGRSCAAPASARSTAAATASRSSAARPRRPSRPRRTGACRPRSGGRRTGRGRPAPAATSNSGAPLQPLRRRRASVPRRDSARCGDIGARLDHSSGRARCGCAGSAACSCRR